MLLLIDNYDSFTHNVADLFAQLGAGPRVVRNDQISLSEIESLAPDYLVFSPGPGEPKQAGITKQAIAHFAGRVPILGICLGHQAIAEVFGGRIRRTQPVHGKTSPILHQQTGVFEGLPNPIQATRYHSLVVDEASFPDQLERTAHVATGEIMGLRHKEFSVEGVQFHPESILSEHGNRLFLNFLSQNR